MNTYKGELQLMMDREVYKKIFRTENDDLADELMQITEIRSFSKGEILISQRRHQTTVYFILKGILRGYFLDDSGSENTICLVHRFGAPVLGASSLDAAGNTVDILCDVVEDAELVCLSVEKLKELFGKYGEVAQIYSQFLEAEVDANWRIQQMLHHYTASKRYEWFLKEYPGVIDRIPHTYVASFLNMTPVSLSRIRGKYKNVRH